MKVFPEIEFTSSEMSEIAASLTRPSVIKYLRSIAYNIGVDICEGDPSPEETAESYLRKQAYVKGGLGVIEMLLQIEPASEQEKS